MFLVAVALAVFTLGAFVGQDLSSGVAMVCSFGGLGMLLVQSFAAHGSGSACSRSAGSTPSPS